MNKKVLIVFGTRPEAIKLAPLISRLIKNKNFTIKICNTGQHKELLSPILDFFEIKIDYDLDLMSHNQGLHELTSKILINLNPIITSFNPDYVIVHGDTTTAFSAALSAFYQKIKILHVEAGLRTDDIYSPFPEELNRTLISSMAYINYAPTLKSKSNIERQNKLSKIIVTGNTVIDALFDSEKKINFSDVPISLNKINFSTNKKIILFTGHRRENFGSGFNNIFDAITELTRLRKDILIVYPLHPNPNINLVAHNYFDKNSNVKLIPALQYQDFLWLLKKCYIVVTDSGGIQEEAPSFGKPVIVTREHSERTEAIDLGSVLLVGSNTDKIIKSVLFLLDDIEKYNFMSSIKNPYGDGKASERIIKSLLDD